MKTIMQQLLIAAMLLISMEGFGQSAGPDQNICINNVTIMAATGTGTWAALGTNPAPTTITNPTSPTTTISGFSSVGVYGFTWAGNTVTVTVHANTLVVTDSTHVNVSCQGGANGSLCISVTGGTPNYTYLWSPGQTSQCITNLLAAGYTMTVTDANLCTATLSFTITQPASALTVATSQVNVACFGSATGSIDLTPSGGTAPYTVAWSGGLIGFNPTNVAVGSYSYTVTDGNGCTAIGTVTITQPASAFTVSVAQTNVRCFGSLTGSITLTLSGGTTPYGAVSWTGGLTGLNPTNLAAGSYIYTIADANGCTKTGTVTITQPASAFTVTNSQTDVLCFGATNGTITLTASGGTTPYGAVTWTGGLTGLTSTNVAAGSYTYNILDANSCPASGTVTITQPTAIAVSSSHTNSNCGVSNGTITLSVSGGTPPYQAVIGGIPATNLTVAALAAGIYSYTVTDANNCTATGSATVGQNGTTPTPTVNNATVCAGNNATLTATGGVSYQWSTGALTPSITTGIAGIYTVTATNASGCTASASGTVTVNNCNDSAGVNQTICLDSIATMAAIGTGTWTALASNPDPTTITTPSSPTTTVSGFDQPGIYSLVWTTGSSIDTMTVTVHTCSPDSVWPGDADANHIVDNNDLLTLGLGYDSSGPARINATIVWQGQQVGAWDQYFTNYTNDPNYNNADCNGDGIINADDTVAIVTNFGLTHAKSGGTGGPWRSGIPALKAVLSADTLYAGDTLTVTFVLGDSANTVADFYGIAFTYNFDPLVVDSNFTTMSFNDSWVGTSSNKISISKVFNDGEIDAAVTRIDHVAVSGYGPIAMASFKITTDNISGKTFSYYPNFGSISAITAIDQHGNKFPLNAGSDSSLVAFTPNGIPVVQTETLHMQPNPAHDRVTISAGNVIQEIRIIDIVGNEVINNTAINSKATSLNVSILSSGVYFVQVRTDRGAGTLKLVVER